VEEDHLLIFQDQLLIKQMDKLNFFHNFIINFKIFIFLGINII